MSALPPPVPVTAAPTVSGSRSVLLSVIAWLAIAASSCTLLAGAALAFLFATGAAPSSLAKSLALGVGVAIASLSIFAAIALLRRRNWSRLYFALLFGIGAIGITTYGAIAFRQAAHSPAGPFMAVIMVVESLPLVALLVWFAVVLLSRKSREECSTAST